jgi:preprotein translocase subunit SecE
MEDNKNQKIITMAFLAVSVLAAFVINILLESAAATWGLMARYYSQDWVQHGIPVLTGLLTFLSLQFNKKVIVWADEVVTELLKVVWPSRKDTMAMTVVVAVMLLISSLILGFFDFLSTNIVKMLLNLKL